MTMHRDTAITVAFRRTRLAALWVLGLVLSLAQAHAAMAFVLPDTGITQCFGNSTPAIVCPEPGEDFYGQDANYAGWYMSYRDNGDGTVTDLVTKLTWQQTDDGIERSWADSIAYCNALTLGTYNDWRAPTRKELLSLVDAGRYRPAINPKLTCSNTMAYYWSATPTTYEPEAYFVSFGNGASANATKTDPYVVRCVRGDVYDGSTYVDNGDGTVSDKTTGLEWEKTPSEAVMTWQAALAHCQALSVSGKTSWRLPNKRELESLVDETRNMQSINPLFTQVGDIFWTSSSPKFSEYHAWVVYFNHGNVWDLLGKTSSTNARCVRGVSGPAAGVIPGMSPLLLGQ